MSDSQAAHPSGAKPRYWREGEFLVVMHRTKLPADVCLMTGDRDVVHQERRQHRPEQTGERPGVFRGDLSSDHANQQQRVTKHGDIGAERASQKGRRLDLRGIHGDGGNWHADDYSSSLGAWLVGIVPPGIVCVVSATGFEPVTR